MCVKNQQKNPQQDKHTQNPIFKYILTKSVVVKKSYFSVSLKSKNKLRLNN